MPARLRLVPGFAWLPCKSGFSERSLLDRLIETNQATSLLLTSAVLTYPFHKWKSENQRMNQNENQRHERHIANMKLGLEPGLTFYTSSLLPSLLDNSSSDFSFFIEMCDKVEPLPGTSDREKSQLLPCKAQELRSVCVKPV